LRFDPRWIALTAALALAVAPPDPSWLALLVPALSPLTALASVVAARAVSLGAALGLPLLVLAIARPRWICRTVCPLGPALDVCGRLRRGGAGRIPASTGRVLLWALLGASAAGWPLLLWLDPFALVNAAGRMARHPVGLASVAAGLGVAIPLLFSVLVPRAWCGRICPLGAMQDVLSGLRRRSGASPVRCSDDEDARTGFPLGRASGPALPIVPEKSVVGPGRWPGRSMDPGSHADVERHPHDQVNETEMRPLRSAPPAASGFPAVSRREVLGAGVGVAAAVAARAAGGTVPAPLRPPGAVPGPRFGAVCVRCGNCAAACPSHIIRPDPGRHGVVSFLSPVLDFSKDYCREDCRRCTEVCPSGALVPLRTLDAKKAWRIGLARVDLGTCLLAAGRECTACVAICPYGAIAVASDGFDSKPVIDPALCNGCGACESVCPVEPVRSILVTAEASRSNPGGSSNAVRQGLGVARDS
jgi:ferredoxin-type protein NapF